MEERDKKDWRYLYEFMTSERLDISLGVLWIGLTEIIRRKITHSSMDEFANRAAVRIRKLNDKKRE